MTHWTSNDLQAMAQVGDADIFMAEMWWKRHAPPRYAQIQDAVPVHSDEERLAMLLLLFLYDTRDARYIVAGRKVQRQIQRGLIDRAISSASREVRDWTERMMRGEITLDEWQDRMAATIRDGHYAAMLLGLGGKGMVDNDDRSLLERVRLGHLLLLLRFVQQIEQGQIRIDGNVLRRALLYVQSIRGTFYEYDRQAALDAGFDLERNVLNPAEHCGGDTPCVDESAKGWVPIGTLVPIGARTCGANCRCDIEFMNSATGATR